MYSVVLPFRDTSPYPILLRIVRRRFQLAAASDVGPQLAPALSFVDLFSFKVSIVFIGGFPDHLFILLTTTLQSLLYLVVLCISHIICSVHLVDL